MNDPQIKERVFQCPHCQGMIHIQVKTEVVGLQKSSEEEVRAQKDYGPELKELLGEIEATGLIEVFGKAARYAQGDQCPKDLVRFFTTFVRSAVTRSIPRFALDCLKDQFPPNGQFQFWQANGIGAVVVDNTLRGFVPLSLVIGQRAKDAGTRENRITLPANPEELEEWFRDGNVKLKPEQWIPFVHLRKVCT